MKVLATWSTLSRCATARVTGKMSSEARGATTTPPSTVPEPFSEKSFTKPSVMPSIFARGFRPSGSMRVSTLPRPASTSFCERPTVAISGSVKMFAETTRRLSGATASPNACDIAIRPCIAATEANGRTPVQSPAAYTLRTDVRETRSTTMCPEGLSSTPISASPMSAVCGIEPTASRACEPSISRPSSRRTTTPSPDSVRSTAAIRERPKTSIPRLRKTSSITSAASGSSPGRTRSRDETRTTSAPRPR